MMRRALPLWLFLLCLLLGGLFTVLFGWSVKGAMSGNHHGGWSGEAALLVASFPDLVSDSFREIAADPDTDLRVPRTGADLTQFHPVRMKSGVDVQGLLVRVDRAALERASGWRVLLGSFMIDGKLSQAALLFSPELEIVKAWILGEDDIEGWKPRAPNRKYVHGFAMLKDGSMIFTFDGGVSIQRFDPCGRRIWATGGVFDHAVTLDEDEKSVWTVANAYGTSETVEAVEIATADGRIVRRISMEDIIAANPAISILEVHRIDDSSSNDNPRNTTKRWHDDPFHLNDVDPLPASIVNGFDGFEAGDLLMSSRALNLLFVIDPENLKVRWWQSGPWRHQHDPDWQSTGEITVYDNNVDREYSKIVSMVPASHRERVLLDGRTNDFYSRIRGKHQLTKAGNILITSPQQGRAFEVDMNGHVVFDMFNTKADSKAFNYPISETLWFPFEAFDSGKSFSCEK